MKFQNTKKDHFIIVITITIRQILYQIQKNLSRILDGNFGREKRQEKNILELRKFFNGRQRRVENHRSSPV